MRFVARRAAWKWLPVAAVAVVTVAHFINMFHAPGLFDDEGTYDSEAWALLHHGTLSHYTYWYDHPPGGWIALSLWYMLTLAYPLHLDLFDAARFFMLFCTAASAALLYVLVRRLGGSALAAAGGVLLFGFTPLGMIWQRETLLDNIATPMLLLAFVLAASPRVRLAPAVGSMASVAAAVLIKETCVLYVPFVTWQLWQNTALERRRLTLWLGCTVGALIVALYPMYAIIKNELFPGPRHVSLLWALWWQIAERRGGGSVLAPHTATHLAVAGWFQADGPLLIGALVGAAVATALRRARPVAWLVLALGAMIFRSGYLPAPYVIGVLWPAATVVVIAVDAAIRRARVARLRAAGARWFRRSITIGLVSALTLSAVTSFTVVLGRDVRGDRALWTSDPVGIQRAAYAWVAQNVHPGDVVIVDNTAWLALVTAGFPERTTMWFPKVDLDPAVARQLPEGWRSVDYVVDSPVLRDNDSQSPTVRQAVAHGFVIASFGSGIDTRIDVLKVRADNTSEATPTGSGKL